MEKSLLSKSNNSLIWQLILRKIEVNVLLIFIVVMIIVLGYLNHLYNLILLLLLVESVGAIFLYRYLYHFFINGILSQHQLEIKPKISYLRFAINYVISILITIAIIILLAIVSDVFTIIPVIGLIIANLVAIAVFTIMRTMKVFIYIANIETYIKHDTSYLSTIENYFTKTWRNIKLGGRTTVYSLIAGVVSYFAIKMLINAFVIVLLVISDLQILLIFSITILLFIIVFLIIIDYIIINYILIIADRINVLNKEEGGGSGFSEIENNLNGVK